MHHLYINEPHPKNGWNYEKRIQGWWKDSLFEVYDAVSKAQPAKGNLCEIGIWYGRSLLPFKNFLNDNEALIGVDLWVKNQKQEVIENITNLYDSPENIILIDGDSTKNQARILSYSPFRMIYIDGGHKYHEALSDLRLAERALSEGGILWLDDYKNHNFGGDVSRAIKHFVNESDFEVAFTSCLQAFLCQSSYKEFYLDVMKTLDWNETDDPTFDVIDFAHPNGFNSWEWVDPNPKS